MFSRTSIVSFFYGVSRVDMMWMALGLFLDFITLTIIAIANVTQSSIVLHLNDGLTLRILTPYQEQALFYGALTVVTLAIIVSLYVAETIAAIRDGEFTLTFGSQSLLGTGTFISTMIPIAIWIVVTNGTDSANAQRIFVAFVYFFYALAAVLIMGAVVFYAVLRYAPRFYMNALVWTVGALASTFGLACFALMFGMSVEEPLFIMMVLLVYRFEWVFLADNISLFDRSEPCV